MTELLWDGKYREGKRSAPVKLQLPFQTVETVNESSQDRQSALDLFASGRPTEWRNRLIWGDKKYVLPSLLPEFSGKVNLIYIDPPFATGADFSFSTQIPGTDTEIEKEPSLIEQKAYRDTWGRGLDSYVQWFYEAAVLLRDLLAENGSIYVHLDANVVHYAKVILDEVFGIENFQREIVWRIGWISGYKSAATNWIRNHDTLLFYSKSKQDFTFNKKYISYPEGYVRRDGKAPTGRGYPVDDVWNGSEMDKLDSIQIMSFSGEKVGYPTQKNESLLERIIEASSNEGDIVLDCFCGSGTTPVVAEKLNRRWIAADLGRFAVQTSRKRLLNTPGVKPFVVQNLGKYERQAWMKAEFEHPTDRAVMEDAYRAFILDLFKADTLTGNAWIHGVKAGRLIHVGAVDSPVTMADVKAIAAEVWKLGGNRHDAPTAAAADILGWEFAFELNETAKQLAATARVDIKFRRIPREVLEKSAIEQGDVAAKDFFELRALSTRVSRTKLKVEIEIADFILPAEDIPAEVAFTIKHWSQWVDYWAVDWDYRNDTFHNQWQSFRSKRQPKLRLTAQHEYPCAGSYELMVKVIDILGNDTTKTISLKVVK